MPDGGLGRFIEIESKMEAKRSTGHQCREVEIAGRCGHRIRVEDEERLNLPRLQIRRQLRQRSSFASWRR
jgi:hypothetical protein